jgi:hypothetical protein
MGGDVEALGSSKRAREERPFLLDGSDDDEP